MWLQNIWIIKHAKFIKITNISLLFIFSEALYIYNMYNIYYNTIYIYIYNFLVLVLFSYIYMRYFVTVYIYICQYIRLNKRTKLQKSDPCPWLARAFIELMGVTSKKRYNIKFDPLHRISRDFTQSSDGYFH